MKNYTINQLAQFIDHTNLKPYATDQNIRQLCDEAASYNFKMVAINQVQSRRCAEYLQGKNVNVGAAIAFPLGQTSIESKVFETQDAIANGATEIDYVINITELKEKNYAYIQQEMEKIVEVCKKHNVISKVIFENCYLDKDEIIKLCQIAKEVKPNFIKTSTGFGPTGATFDDVKLMKETVGNTVKVKAAGGIRDLDTFLKMIQSGAERIGTSSGIQIIESLKAKLEKEKKETIAI